ncbi:hypothetical protein DFJ74DRAFT_108776 [Hyaloraphidium curvatum]|nr:hypothetical protein DFJ74DRAFT_108776 [Hyaloraphidium curvatum]
MDRQGKRCPLRCGRSLFEGPDRGHCPPCGLQVPPGRPRADTLPGPRARRGRGPRPRRPRVGRQACQVRCGREPCGADRGRGARVGGVGPARGQGAPRGPADLYHQGDAGSMEEAHGNLQPAHACCSGGKVGLVVRRFCQCLTASDQGVRAAQRYGHPARCVTGALRRAGTVASADSRAGRFLCASAEAAPPTCPGERTVLATEPKLTRVLGGRSRRTTSVTPWRRCLFRIATASTTSPTCFGPGRDAGHSMPTTGSTWTVSEDRSSWGLPQGGQIVLRNKTSTRPWPLGTKRTLAALAARRNPGGTN